MAENGMFVDISGQFPAKKSYLKETSCMGGGFNVADLLGPRERESIKHPSHWISQ